MSKPAIFLILILFFVRGQCCDLSEDLKNEIRGYHATVNDIFTQVLSGDYKGRLYNVIETLIDQYGARYAGGHNLENAINFTVDNIKEAHLDVNTTQVNFKSWIRREESAKMTQPINLSLSILGLQNSGATPKEGIEADVVVVSNLAELETRSNEIKDKIVLINTVFESYGKTGVARLNGPNSAKNYGAKAVLVRSITPFSIDSPHGGLTIFENGSIPAAAISLEHANVIARYIKDNKTVTVFLALNSSLDDKESTSRNIIASISGKKNPHEVIVVSSHIDSLDIGQGVQNNAGGAYLSWYSLALLKALGLTTNIKRTLKAVIWTAEELGVSDFGSENTSNWQIALVSNLGIYSPIGLSSSGDNHTMCVVEEIARLFDKINATGFFHLKKNETLKGEHRVIDAPTLQIAYPENNYFWYHNTAGDTLDKIIEEDLDKNLAMFASTLYILSNLSLTVGRKVPETIEPTPSNAAGQLPVTKVTEVPQPPRSQSYKPSDFPTVHSNGFNVILNNLLISISMLIVLNYI